jgi:hypothetical protein
LFSSFAIVETYEFRCSFPNFSNINVSLEPYFSPNCQPSFSCCQKRNLFIFTLKWIAFSMSRHDEAIASLMSEWSQHKGFQSTAVATEKKATVPSLRKKERIQELQGYPNSHHLAGTNAVW